MPGLNDKEVVPEQEKQVGPASPVQDKEFSGEKEFNGVGDDVEAASLPGSTGKGDVLGLEHTDPVLNAKMHLVNNVR